MLRDFKREGNVAVEIDERHDSVERPFHRAYMGADILRDEFEYIIGYVMAYGIRL